MIRCLLFILLTFGLIACSSEEPPLPTPVVGVDIYLKPENRVVEDRIPRNSTIASLLTSYGMTGNVVYAFAEAMRPVFNPRSLRSGHPYKLIYGPDGDFRRFEYHINDDQFLQVVNRGVPSIFEVLIENYEKQREQVSMRGEINREYNSLVAAMDAGGGHYEITMAMADVFSAEIDFSTELRFGDSFSVLYERFVRDDIHVTYGDILAASFTNDGRELNAFRFEASDDVPSYFDSNGHSMRRQFLRSPFRFEPRVTSRFSYRRLHPILDGHRAHLGVDYGAPTGTPVIAVANGVVIAAVASGGSGNMVRLRHTNGYETYYLHLSRFAQGMRPGGRVVQGQIIGYVGSTGLATGPHLDYRLRKNGTFVNPLVEHRNLPPGDPVPPGQMVAFQAVRDDALLQLSGRQPQINNFSIVANTN